METWKKNVENMENAQKALKYAIKSFYFLKKHVFYTPYSLFPIKRGAEVADQSQTFHWPLLDGEDEDL